MNVLNLKHSPEKALFWMVPILSAWEQATRKVRPDECRKTTRGLRLHRAVQRYVGNQACDDQGLLGKRAMQYPSMGANVKRGTQMAASLVMGTGTPQWLAVKWSNVHGAKVPTDCHPTKRKHRHYARSG